MTTLEDLFTFQGEPQKVEVKKGAEVHIHTTKGGLEVPLLKSSSEGHFWHLLKSSDALRLPNDIDSELIDFHGENRGVRGSDGRIRYVGHKGTTIIERSAGTSLMDHTPATFRFTYMVDNKQMLRSVSIRYWMYAECNLPQVGKDRIPPSGQFRVHRLTPSSFSVDGTIEGYRHHQGRIHFTLDRSGAAPNLHKIGSILQPVLGKFNPKGVLNFDSYHTICFESEKEIDYGRTIAQVAKVMQTQEPTVAQLKSLEHLDYLHFR